MISNLYSLLVCNCHQKLFYLKNLDSEFLNGLEWIEEEEKKLIEVKWFT